jgi:protein required for attachment to host cells
MRSKAWVLVMNGDKAIFLIRNKKHKLKEFFCLTRQPEEDSHESKNMMTDSNRTYRHLHHAFYEEVRSTLEKYRAEGIIDSLYLVAAPKVLGNIREGLDKKTKEKVKKAIPKDVAEFDTKALAAFLEGNI